MLGSSRGIDADFDSFVIGRSAALLRTAVLLTGHRHDAEDLLQTTLLRLARHWSRELENPDAYARRVMVNLAVDRRRRHRRHPELLGDVLELATEHSIGGGGAAGESVAEDGGELLDALRSLPRRQRATVVLRFWEDMSVAEAAAMLGCTEGTVKSATSKGLAHLRDVLQSPNNLTHADRALREGVDHADR